MVLQGDMQQMTCLKLTMYKTYSEKQIASYRFHNEFKSELV